MVTYEDVLNLIYSALTQRPAGTQVQVAEHQRAEIALLEYIEQLKNQYVQTVSEAHGVTKNADPCFMAWSQPFKNLDYSWVINGFDSRGAQVGITLLKCLPEGILVSTTNDATLYAIAMPYNPLPDEPLNDPTT